MLDGGGRGGGEGTGGGAGREGENLNGGARQITGLVTPAQPLPVTSSGPRCCWDLADQPSNSVLIIPTTRDYAGHIDQLDTHGSVKRASCQ